MAVAAAVAAGIVAGHAGASPDRFPSPKLDYGVLRVKGTHASDKITLRLQAGDPGVLQVDVGDDGSADFSFERDDLASIALNARPGDDLVRIDESNGVFADTHPDDHRRRRRQRHPGRRLGNRGAARRARQRHPDRRLRAETLRGGARPT